MKKRSGIESIADLKKHYGDGKGLVIYIDMDEIDVRLEGGVELYVCEYQHLVQELFPESEVELI